MPSPHPPEKNKKVSRACNTCRLKRKKCDGLEPCIFCTETKVECSYSREPRRRGPPSGYLRYTETRVALLETLLAQSKTHTQDVWDAYKHVWTDCDASRRVHELAGVFAPFSPTDNQTPAPKSLLPPPGRQKQPVRSPSPSPPPPAWPYTNESFERTTHEPASTSNDLAPMQELRRTSKNAQVPVHAHVPDIVPQMDLDLQADLPMPMFLPSPPADSVSSSSAYPCAYWCTAALASPPPAFASLNASRAPTPAPADLPPPHVRAALLATYRAAVHPSLPIISPAQIVSLDASSSSAPSTSNMPTTVDTSPMLLLALCAYTARLSPPAASPTRAAAELWYEASSALLVSTLCRATIHIDAVQTLLLLALRDHGRGRDAMAWRAVGAASVTVEDEDGERDRAWERGLWGVATMMDLFLSIQLGRAPACAEALRPLALPLVSARPSVSPSVSASTVSANSTTSFPSPLSSLSSPSAHTSTDTDSRVAHEIGGDGGRNEVVGDDNSALFAPTRALVRIVARVHFWVGLGYGVASGPETLVPASAAGSYERGTEYRGVAYDGTTEDTTHALLIAELAAWHHTLPQRFRVALGGERVPRAVLEVHMLYQVGVGMLGRGRRAPPSDSASGSGEGLANSYQHDAAADDAASTFNVLLDKYHPSLALAGPHVVWLVFAELAHASPTLTFPYKAYLIRSA
ncbi:hypothetical protein B0H11DRAFT_2237048 [Mycena galericulata]|nr:hypothetical protein B0H11DRAFT_2237048 [Mycena galericulata]